MDTHFLLTGAADSQYIILDSTEGGKLLVRAASLLQRMDASFSALAELPTDSGCAPCFTSWSASRKCVLEVAIPLYGCLFVVVAGIQLCAGNDGEDDVGEASACCIRFSEQ
jgi:hypothetical protein